MDTDYWRKKLQNYKADLLKVDEDSEHGRQAVELDQTRVGRLSRMDALQGQAMNNAIAARRAQLLVKIENALNRLEDDEFGYCIKCGDDIPQARLELDPAISICTECAS